MITTLILTLLPIADVHQEFIYDHAPFPSCHASTLIECGNGDLLAAWFGGTEEGESDVAIWMARRKGSQPEGAWSPPAEAARHPGIPCWNPVLFREQSGRIWLFYKVGRSPEAWSGAYKISTDDGATFGPSTILPAGLLGPIKNKPIELPGGIILCGTSVESWQAWTCWVERIGDGGKRWSRYGPIAIPGNNFGLIQPTFLASDDGKLIRMLARSRGLGRIYTATSKNGGFNWTPAAPTQLPNPNSGIDAVRLRDGRSALVYNHTERGRTPLNVALSKDLGKTWTPALVLEHEPGEYSYPAAIQLQGGDLAITYTWRRQRIRFARVPLADLKN